MPSPTPEPSASTTPEITTETTAENPRAAADRPETTVAPAVFRIPPAALVAVVFLALCLSPIAFQGGAWFALFLAPVAVGGAVLVTRTTVDTGGIRVRLPWRATTLPWSRVATLRLADRSWVRAVPVSDSDGGCGDREVVLPCVRVKDLGRVAEASGGRITAPTPEQAQAAEEQRRELEATRMRIARMREAGQVEEDAPEEAPEEAPAADQQAGRGVRGDPPAPS